ncbi:hypothetical protein GCM10011445_05000 [Pseudocitrobacter faecalis]|nr:hypothetical protein GCM10011445_05000 [Pseudocitrobacter faecalis]
MASHISKVIYGLAAEERERITGRNKNGANISPAEFVGKSGDARKYFAEKRNLLRA